jgi:hypothetical protein
MKKPGKIMLIICGACCGLGIILCIIGFLMGATLSQVSEAFSIRGKNEYRFIQYLEDKFDGWDENVGKWEDEVDDLDDDIDRWSDNLDERIDEHINSFKNRYE